MQRQNVFIYTELHTMCTVHCTRQLAAFAYWLKQINANAHKTMYVHMHKINAIVFSLHSVHSHSHSISVVCFVHTYFVSVASVSESNCVYNTIHISIVLMILLHAICGDCKQYLSLLPSLAFSLLHRLCTLLKAFFRPFLNC